MSKDSASPFESPRGTLNANLGKEYPESSFSSMLFGIVVGALLNASMTYAGLKIGYTVPASTVAAILGFGILRGVLRRGTILEVNLAQSVASSVQLPSSGVIFTVPVLILLGIPLDPRTADFWWIAVGCTAGAVLGSAFIIPIRKQMIEFDRLRFPSGVAVAAILKSPGAGMAKSVVLLASALLGGLLYLPTQLDQLAQWQFLQSRPALKGWADRAASWGYGHWEWRLPAPAADGAPQVAGAIPDWDVDQDGRPDLVLTSEELHLGRFLGIPAFVVVVFALSPLSIGAGYLSGKPGLVVLAGGILAYWLLNPLAYLAGMFPLASPSDVEGLALRAYNRPLGIGLLLGGAIMGLLTALPTMLEALRSLAKKRAKAGNKTQELGWEVLLPAMLVSFVGLWLAATYTRNAGINEGWLRALPFWLQNLTLAAIGSGWMWFGGIVISQCAGMTDWSPISGMALLTVLLVMTLAGTSQVMAAVVLGSAMCVSVTCAADMMQDLKTGQLLGARPAVQQSAQLFTAALGPILALGTILVLIAGHQRLQRQTQVRNADAGGAAVRSSVEEDSSLPFGPGSKLPAQQAQALQSVILGVQGGNMPVFKYGCGALAGIALGLWGFPGLGVLVGLSMYLGIASILTYGLGCLLNMLVSWLAGEAWAEEWGVPCASGLIVGESLVALFFSLLAVAM